jgi:hypothetical protein
MEDAVDRLFRRRPPRGDDDNMYPGHDRHTPIVPIEGSARFDVWFLAFSVSMPPAGEVSRILLLVLVSAGRRRGGGRMHSFARYLPEHDWGVHVLTAKLRGAARVAV